MTTTSEQQQTPTQQQTQQICYRIVHVKNIDSTISSAEISKLFGFHQTPFLRKNTCVEIINDGDDEDQYAKVVCPDYIRDEVLKMNGIEFYNKKLIIETAPEDEDEADSQAEQTAEGEEDEILHLLLDCRNHPDLNFPRVLEYEVCDALNADFPDDVHKTVITGRGMKIGTFQIESDDFKQYDGKKIKIRSHEIDLIPIRKRKDSDQREQRRNFDPNGVKVRIFGAWKLQFKSIEDSAFDDYFTKRGIDIIRPTQPERCRERRDVFNSNRYIVIRTLKDNGDKVNLADLGDRIEVGGIEFNIWYAGKLHYCGLCKIRHGWHCASQLRHDFLRKLRKGKTEKCKIYSDSTLRLTNQLALTADVACMSGGGIGQICNVIPFDQPHDEIIINAGTNEMNGSDLQEFVYTVDKTREKLETLAAKQPVTLVLPEIKTDAPEIAARGMFMEESFNQVNNVKVVSLKDIETDDHRGHPSAKGTVALIKQIHSTTSIIMKNCLDDVLSPQIYRGVQSLFKTGCRACSKLEFTPFLCNDCKDNSKLVDTTKIDAATKVLRDQMYPQMNIDTTGIKRGREEENNDVGNNNGDGSKKPAISM